MELLSLDRLEAHFPSIIEFAAEYVSHVGPFISKKSRSSACSMAVKPFSISKASSQNPCPCSITNNLIFLNPKYSNTVRAANLVY